ncbi:MAG: T9SS type A sorting domain-containing protein [Chitinophagales bacterium]|nr:T9SS type A sorting domain-containing protein [Chitinophagales bacterium]
MKPQIQIFTVCLLAAVLFSLNTYGQCTANAGKDSTFCVSIGIDAFYLGGSPSVIGGTPPYTYTWTCSYSILNSLFYSASDYLNDTSTANPLLIEHNSDTLAFYLTVSDSLGNICSDTIIVKFCSYVWSLEDKFVVINQGDTTQLYPGIGSGCPPLLYEWSPNYYISDPNVSDPFVSPDTTTYYIAMVTDSAGCQGYDEPFEVYVIPTGTNDHQIPHVIIDIFPNPLYDRSTIRILRPDRSELKIEFYDAFGRVIKQMRIIDNLTEIKRDDFKAGIFFYRVFENNIFIGQGKLIVD